jgi:hypothetical protein
VEKIEVSSQLEYDIYEFFLLNRQELIIEIRNSLESFELVNDIVVSSTEQSPNLEFDEYIVAVFQALMVEFGGFTIEDSLNVVDREFLEKLVGSNIFNTKFWDYSNYN